MIVIGMAPVFFISSEEMPVVMAMEFEILNQTGSSRQITWRVDCAKGQDHYASKFVTEISGSQDQLKEVIPLIKVSIIYIIPHVPV